MTLMVASIASADDAAPAGRQFGKIDREFIGVVLGEQSPLETSHKRNLIDNEYRT